MGDDRVVESRFRVGWVFKRTYWGPDTSSSVNPQPSLTDLKRFERPSFQTITVDRDATTEIVHLAREVFDRVLPVKLRQQWYWSYGPDARIDETARFRAVHARYQGESPGCAQPDGVFAGRHAGSHHLLENAACTV